MKQCTRCGANERYKTQSVCYPCHRERVREYEARYPDRVAAKSKAWREKNLVRAQDRGRRHYEANRGYYAAKNAEWIRNNPEANRARRRRYRARKLAAEGSFTVIEWLDLLAAYQGKCLGCGACDRVEPDHVIPLVAGGPDTIDNIQPLCRSCNASKNTRTVDLRLYGPPCDTSILLRSGNSWLR